MSRFIPIIIFGGLITKRKLIEWKKETVKIEQLKNAGFLCYNNEYEERSKGKN